MIRDLRPDDPHGVLPTTHGRPIRVLVVDDSILTRRVICAALETAPDITIVGTASSGAEGLDRVETLRPDVVTLDVEMPGMDGLTALGHLMDRSPVPVIMISYLTREGADVTVRALFAGAVDFVAKPGGPIVRDLTDLRDELIRKVRAAARARLTRPRLPTPLDRAVRPTAPRPTALTPLASSTPPRPRPGAARRFDRLVVVGASTGGPQALQTVMSGLSADASTAYVVVQHMPAGMTSVLADILDGCSPLTVREAVDGDRLEPGTALLAPGDLHLRLGPQGVVHLDQGPKVHWVRPSVDVALLSAAELYGEQTIAAVLTGMGMDGADGAEAIAAAGGIVIAEHESTCVVWGMPKAVAKRGVADAIVPLPEIARAILARLRESGPAGALSHLSAGCSQRHHTPGPVGC